jgi:hypothetical protein
MMLVEVPGGRTHRLSDVSRWIGSAGMGAPKSHKLHFGILLESHATGESHRSHPKSANVPGSPDGSYLVRAATESEGPTTPHRPDRTILAAVGSAIASRSIENAPDLRSRGSKLASTEQLRRSRPRQRTIDDRRDAPPAAGSRPPPDRQERPIRKSRASQTGRSCVLRARCAEARCSWFPESWPNGSSISRIGGLWARARASATRCCIPPESSLAARSSQSRALDLPLECGRSE